MSWWGAGIGAGIGAMLGGPLGALIGGWLGYALGSDDSEKASESSSQRLGQDEKQFVFFVAVFSMLAKMAKADGRVSQKEADRINRFAREELELDEEGRKAAREVFRRALEDDQPIEAYAEQLRDLFPEEVRIVVYRVLFEVASADGGIHETEREILKRLPQHLGIGEHLFDALWEELLGVPANLEEHYQVLGLAPGASLEEVRRAYRRLSKEYHPDRIASLGLPEGFQRFATEQMQRINAAYDAIMRAQQRAR